MNMTQKWGWPEKWRPTQNWKRRHELYAYPKLKATPIMQMTPKIKLTQSEHDPTKKWRWPKVNMKGRQLFREIWSWMADYFLQRTTFNGRLPLLIQQQEPSNKSIMQSNEGIKYMLLSLKPNLVSLIIFNPSLNVVHITSLDVWNILEVM